MNPYKIIAIGDNVCDKYLSRGKMYPGGQCVNTCVYARMNNTESAYLGKFGSDNVAEIVESTLSDLGIDSSRSRHFKGENGFALVTLKDNDRVFLGSNKGGIAREHPFDFTEDDLIYISKFDLIYTNLNSYIEADLPLLMSTAVPIAYDFSTRWTDDYLREVGQYITVAILSCAHLSDKDREREMRKAQKSGISIVLGTVGEKGSYVLYDNELLFVDAVHSDCVLDTMGAGDSYFTAFLCTMLANSCEGQIVFGTHANMMRRLKQAMDVGASFAATTVSMEGAFGHGVPIQGRVTL